MMTFDKWLQQIECEVCSNSPNEDGEIQHGKGCYVVHDEGGGYTQAVTLKDAWNAATEHAAKIVERECEDDGDPEQLRNLVKAIRAAAS